MIDPLALGATLYIPCDRDDLVRPLIGPGRIAGLRSAVLCLEDAILARDVPDALVRLAALLRLLRDRAARPGDPLLFVRPRDPAMLARVLRMPGVERLAGFVLPKATPDTLPDWLALPFHDAHRLMPTLETREAFDPVAMARLRDQLLAVQARILLLRIGGNDLLRTMGLRRAAGRTAYEGPLGPAIAQLVGQFAPWGFALSAPVLEQFADLALLRAEMARDIEHGLLTKTAIHPDQVATIHAALAVAADQLEEARAMLAPDHPAVAARDGVMTEPATHRAWAERLVARAAMFGVAAPLPVARWA